MVKRPVFILLTLNPPISVVQFSMSNDLRFNLVHQRLDPESEVSITRL